MPPQRRHRVSTIMAAGARRRYCCANPGITESIAANIGRNVMPEGSDDRRRVSRRNLFKQVGVVGAAAALSGTTGAEPAAAQTPAATPRREALETLTAAEGETLEAIVARLIPSDENGPGAAEARAAHYIDRALTGPLR